MRLPSEASAPLPPLRLRPSRLRRSGAKAAALALVLLAHGAWLLSWGSPAPPALPSPEPATVEGGGGIRLSLVPGLPGAPSADLDAAGPAAAPGAQATPQAAADPRPDAPAPPQPAAAPAEPAPKPQSGAAAAGTQGSGVAPAPAPSAGQGYDPWAHASYAPPPSVDAAAAGGATPGLWEAVARCYGRTRPAAPLALAVVLDGAGGFVDAYAADPAQAARADRTGEATAQALDALRACSPYPALKAGLAARPLLVVPGRG